MFKILPAILVSLFLYSAAAVAAETPYNMGVKAWQIKDYAQARQHWEQSLEAQAHLGDAYLEGRRVEPSRTKAYAWFQCAIATATRVISAGLKPHLGGHILRLDIRA